MTTTPCGRMEPTPGPTAAFDLNQALLQSREQARAQWAEGLSQFQSQMAAIADTSMQEVVQAAVGPGVGSIRPQGVVVIEGTAGPAPACLGY